MKALLLLSSFLFVGQTFAATVLCTGMSGKDHSTMAVTVSSQNEPTAIVRKKGSTMPFLTEEDYKITEIKKVSENAATRIYDITGEEGDQSYYNARLVVPKSGPVTRVGWQYAMSGDDSPLGTTKLILRCK